MGVQSRDFSFRSSWLGLLDLARLGAPVEGAQNPIAHFVACHQKKLFAEGVAICDSSFDWLRGKVEPLSQQLQAEGRGKAIGKLITAVIEGRANKAEKTLHSSKLHKVELQFQNAQDAAFEEGIHAWVADPSVGGDKQSAAQEILSVYRYRSPILSLSSRGLEGLPPEITKMTWLTDLYLAHNCLESLPDNFAALHRVQDLQINNNRFTSLPFDLGDLPCLKRLTLWENQLESLPPGIWELEGISDINVSGNRLTELPEFTQPCVDIKKIDLSRNHLGALPKGLEYLPNLVHLDASDNWLEEFPRVSPGLMKVRELNLSGCRIQTVPSEIRQLRELRRIDLSRNGLEDLPEEIWDLSRLNCLALSHNQLSHFPGAGNRQLQDHAWTRLELDFNQFQELPEEVGQLPLLSRLTAAHNQLRVLPPEMVCRQNLRTLYIGQNPDLNEIPLTWASFPRLTDFNWEETGIPAESAASILQVSDWRWRRYNPSTFPLLVLRWRSEATGLSSRSYDLGFLQKGPNVLSSDEQSQVGEWLHRLARTADFRRNQARLADIVCSMLESLKSNVEFREAFFAQVGANLACCQDRAAMSLNEIYTSWVLHNLAEESSFSEKVKLLFGVARTTVLRKILAAKLSESGGGGRESVETYLYFENLLKKDLDLVSAAEGMDYAGCANTNLIPAPTLKGTVRRRYFEEFLELPPLQDMLKNDAEFECQWRNRVQKLIDELAEFEEQVSKEGGSDQESDYLSHQHAFGLERAEAVREWIETQLSKEESALIDEKQSLDANNENLEPEMVKSRLEEIESQLVQVKGIRTHLKQG